MSNKQQPPLPTLQPGDSHMESLIEAAIQVNADTREAMRWLVRQLVPATQPAEVTDERLLEIGREWTKEVGWYEFEVNDFIGCARAILALRPVQVPMTEGTARQFVEWMKAQPEDREPTTIDGALAEFEVSIGIPNGAPPHDLWCIHIPGPDEVYAAPSKEAAEHMAAKHNAAMAMYYASGALNLEHSPPLESVRAVVIKWPHDQQSHADELREFDYASWGITAQAKKETP